MKSIPFIFALIALFARAKTPDVAFVPTPQTAVDEMLDLAEVKPTDTVYDLGSGDGRIVVSAAKRGAKAVGYDINPTRVREGRENIRSNKVDHLAKIFEGDIFEQDLSGATVVTLYLLPALNDRLVPQLNKMRPGSRVVSYDFGIAGSTPKKTIEMSNGKTIYLWETPITVYQ